MLVLSRRRGERIVLSNLEGARLGTIEVVEVRGDKVRLGLVAPTEVVIMREELLDEPTPEPTPA